MDFMFKEYETPGPRGTNPSKPVIYWASPRYSVLVVFLPLRSQHQRYFSISAAAHKWLQCGNHFKWTTWLSEDTTACCTDQRLLVDSPYQPINASKRPQHKNWWAQQSLSFTDIRFGKYIKVRHEQAGESTFYQHWEFPEVCLNSFVAMPGMGCVTWTQLT